MTEWKKILNILEKDPRISRKFLEITVKDITNVLPLNLTENLWVLLGDSDEIHGFLKYYVHNDGEVQLNQFLIRDKFTKNGYGKMLLA